jgi:peptidoglycan/LPS O-acetylase OafA/YrhL
MRYRSDIDGLRSLAILPVVLYHTQIGPFTGGFVGVDIFFVISGYLITGIIAEETGQNRFSLLRFYERRVRRIFPALFAMLAAVLALGLALLPPGDLLDEGRSLIYTVLFLSNVHFAKADGYFDAPSELKPLLHTWSLAVEEQFYLLFPLLLILIQRFAKRRFGPFILALGALSFAASLWAVAHAPLAAFYGAPFRAWELMMGASLALGFAPPLKPGWLAQGLALAGLGLIAYAVFGFDAATPFPGLAALAPCLGAALLLYTGPCATLPARLLGTRPLVFIGQISYSLYLWHWPIIAFWRVKPTHLLDWHDGLAILALSFAAATLSWRFVERPFRGTSSVVGRRAVFAGAGALAAALIVAGFGLRATNGAAARYAAYPDARASLTQDMDLRAAIALTPCRDPALMRRGIDDGTEAYCQQFGSLAAPRPIVLWGDSHADAWLPVFTAAAEHLHLHGIVISVSGCPPLLGVKRTDPGALSSHCADTTQGAAILRYIESQAPSQVFLAGRWSLYSHGWTSHGRLNAQTHFLALDGALHANGETSRAALTTALPQTVAALGRIAPVTLIRTVPVLKLEAPNIALLPQALQARYLPSRAEQADFEQFTSTLFASLEAQHRVRLFNPASRLCAGLCAFSQNRGLLYIDDNHLSAMGALLFQNDIEGLLTEENQAELR